MLARLFMRLCRSSSMCLASACRNDVVECYGANAVDVDSTHGTALCSLRSAENSHKVFESVLPLPQHVVGLTTKEVLGHASLAPGGDTVLEYVNREQTFSPAQSRRGGELAFAGTHLPDNGDTLPQEQNLRQSRGPELAGKKIAVRGHVARDGNCLWRAAAKAMVLAGGPCLPWQRLKKQVLRHGALRRGYAWARAFRAWGSPADRTCLEELAQSISHDVIVDMEDATYQAGSNMDGARIWLSLCSEHYEPLLLYQCVAQVWPIHMLAEKPVLTGDGKAGLSVGDQVKRLQQVSPEYAQAQLKGILAVAPALRKLLDAGASRVELKTKLEHEAGRLRVSHSRGDHAKDGHVPRPKLKLSAQKKASQGGTERFIERKSVKLVPHQLFFQGMELPIRPVLIGGSMPGVSLAANQEQVSDMEKKLHASSTVQVLLSPKRYQISQCQVQQALLRFTITVREDGEEREHDADLSVFMYIYGGDAIEVRTLAKEVQLKVAETHVVRVKLTKETVQPNVWVPYNGTAKEVDSYLKQHAVDFRSLLKDVWSVSKSASDGTALARVKDEDLLRVLEMAQEAKIVVQPPRPFMEQMAVLWYPAQPSSWHQAVLITRELCTKLGTAQGDRWGAQSALAVSTKENGKLTYGIRVPMQMKPAAALALGVGSGSRWVIRGCLAEWNAADVADVCRQLGWQVENVRPLGKHSVWQVQAVAQPPQRYVTVKAGYCRTSLSFDPWVPRKEQTKTQERKETSKSWASLFGADLQHEHKSRASQDGPAVRTEGKTKYEWSPSPQDAGGSFDDAWCEPSTEEEVDVGVDCEDSAWQDWDDMEVLSETGEEVALQPPRKRGRDGSSNASTEELESLRQENQQLRARLDEVMLQLQQFMQQQAAVQQQILAQRLPSPAPPIDVPQSERGCPFDEARAGHWGKEGQEDVWIEYTAVSDDLESNQLTYRSWHRVKEERVAEPVAVYRLPWTSTELVTSRLTWPLVSGEQNRCWWASVVAHLAAEGQNLEWQELKRRVIEGALRLPQQFGQEVGVQSAKWQEYFTTLSQQPVMANELAIIATAVVLQRPLLVVESQRKAVLLFVPSPGGALMDMPPLCFWLQHQHFWPGLGALGSPVEWVLAMAPHDPVVRLSGGRRARKPIPTLSAIDDALTKDHLTDWEGACYKPWAHRRGGNTLSVWQLNGNSWQSALKQVKLGMEVSRRPVAVALQEHRQDESKMSRMKAQGHAAGWQVFGVPAKVTAKLSTTGGVALLVAKHVAAVEVPGPVGSLEDRAVAVEVQLTAHKMILVSLYAQVSKTQQDLWREQAELQTWMQAQTIPVCVFGDFNIRPQAWGGPGWFAKSGTLVTVGMPTCHLKDVATEIDFVIVDPGWARNRWLSLAPHVATLSKPHDLLEFVFEKRMAEERVTAMASAKRLPCLIPWNPPPDPTFVPPHGTYEEQYMAWASAADAWLSAGYDMEASCTRSCEPRRKQVSTKRHYAQKLLTSWERPQAVWLLARRCLQQGLNPCQISALFPMVEHLPPFELFGCTWMWSGIAAGYCHAGEGWQQVLLQSLLDLSWWEAKRHERDAQKAWRVQVAQNVSAGNAAGYAWVKAHEQPLPASHPAGRGRSAFGQICQPWSCLWKDGATSFEDVADQGDWDISEKDVDFAFSHSVPTKAPGYDMWSPWHWDKLPDSLRREAVRLTRAWPKQATAHHHLWTTQYVLIPRPGGGLRPIGLAMAMVRAFSKAAAHAVRHLDRQLDTHLQVGHGGAPCDRAALFCLLRAEAALAQRLAYASVLLDVSKAYERVKHGY
eukprot:1047833-Amphidinium_carterae.1